MPYSSRNRPQARPADGEMPGGRKVRIGFVPLIDAAPVIVAVARGYLADEGLHGVLERQLGWGNVRDKLAFGHLDASHALLGLPLESVIRRNDAATAIGGEPFLALLPLGTGGDAITLSKRLTRANVRTPAMLLEHIRRNLSSADPRPALGHVLRSSVHHYLLRAWLAAGGVDPDRDVRLCVLPPPQMASQLAAGHIDGYCVGEPWNTRARLDGSGEIVALTTDTVPDHPDKVLAVRGSLARSEPELLVRLSRAVIRAARWCETPDHQSELIDLLSRPEHLDLDAGFIRESIGFEQKMPATRAGGIRRRRSFEVGSVDTLGRHIMWLAGQMLRWGHLPADTAIDSLPSRCTLLAVLAEAFETLESSSLSPESVHV
ncbi:MAG: CmpA/NrtA family ABC transporter substrate-binding protein [Tepidisphaeraceae bacterium]